MLQEALVHRLHLAAAELQRLLAGHLQLQVEMPLAMEHLVGVEALSLQLVRAGLEKVAEQERPDF
jgi:hypothetical protein